MHANPDQKPQIVFVDTAVEDYQYLATLVKPGIEAIAIDSQQDGIAQISQILAQRQGMNAVHSLNETGGNRTIEIFENLYSYSPDKITHIGASFTTGSYTTDINNPKKKSVPEPSSVLGILSCGAFGIASRLKRR